MWQVPECRARLCPGTAGGKVGRTVKVSGGVRRVRISEGCIL
jgi:hypothetical protein